MTTKKAMLLLASSACLMGCHKDELVSDTNYKSVLGTADFKLHKGILYVKNQSVLDSLSRVLIHADKAFVVSWEKSIGIKSIRSIYKKAIDEENAFLENLVRLHGDDPSLTRAKIGYSPYTKTYLDKGTLLLYEDETLKMNITSPAYGSLLNENRLVNVEGKLIQFNSDNTKIIWNGDMSKIPELNHVKTSNDVSGISCYNVNYDKINITHSKIETWTSCDVHVGQYRLIAYENILGYFIGSDDGCNFSDQTYWVTLRSLKRILGTWQNHNTNFLSVTGNVKIELWGMSSSDPDFLAKTLVDESNVTHVGEFDDVFNHYYLDHYPSACYFSSTNYSRQLKFRKHDFVAFGKNNTSCSLGSLTPVCYFGTECPD